MNTSEKPYIITTTSLDFTNDIFTMNNHKLIITEGKMIPHKKLEPLFIASCPIARGHYQKNLENEYKSKIKYYNTNMSIPSMKLNVTGKQMVLNKLLYAKLNSKIKPGTIIIHLNK